MSDVLVNPLPNPLAKWFKSHRFVSQFIHNFPLLSSLNDSASSDVVSLTRASSKTFIKDDGTLETVTSNNAAFTGSGILIEPSHTNLLTYSQQLDNAAWTKNGMSISANTGETTDPLGSNTADKWIAVTNDAANNINQSISGASSSNYYASVFLKAGSVEYALITTNDNLGNASGLRVDLANGTITSETTAGAMSVSDSGVVSVGNGWYYFWYETTTTAGITTLTQYVYGDNADGSPTRTLTGEYIYVWEVDLVQANYHLSPVPTTTASATSLKDDYSMDLSEIPANDFYIELDWTPKDTSSCVPLAFRDASNGIIFSQASSTALSCTIATGAMGGVVLTFTPTAGTTYKLRAEKSSTSGLSFEVVGVTSGTEPTATGDIVYPSTGYIGSNFTGVNHINGTIANLKIGAL